MHSVDQALLKRCEELSSSGDGGRCNLDDTVDSGSGWFQMNFVKGTLMHVFAAAGHRELAELWMRAGGSSAPTDRVGTTPAMIAARNGYFSFPGAAAAAKTEGLTTEPFGFTMRRELKVPSGLAMEDGGWSGVEADLTKLGIDEETRVDLERCVSSKHLHCVISQNLTGVPDVAGATLTKCSRESPLMNSYSSTHLLHGRLQSEVTNRRSSMFSQARFDYYHRAWLSTHHGLWAGGCRDWQWSKRWERETFLNAHGDDVFEVSDVQFPTPSTQCLERRCLRANLLLDSGSVQGQLLW